MEICSCFKGEARSVHLLSANWNMLIGMNGEVRSVHLLSEC